MRFLVFLLLLGVLCAKSLPKWAQKCIVVVQKESVLACGKGLITSSNTEYALDLAKTQATEKILSFLHSDTSATIEMSAKNIKARYIGFKEVYVLLEIKKSFIKNVKGEEP
ncbi:hypothetical protein [Helicobacter cetorum]|uniref:hypothetical protein n=1 Tax=Helicobacter cetorum TaxID=138563 RepID=UPI000CF07F8C|nr:hypothetical protein [Helicobacter cetorum]